MPASEPPSDPARERGSRAALAGVVFAVLFTVGWALLRTTPAVGTPDDEVIDYFTSAERRRTSLITGLYVTPLAGLAFIWFMAAFRARIVRASGQEHAIFSSVQLITGTLFVGMIFVAGGAELAAYWLADRADDGVIDVASARATLALGASMSLVFALRTVSAFIAVSTTRAMRAGLFPRWFTWVSYAIAVALMTVATNWRAVMLLIPVWVIGVSVVVVTTRPNRHLPTEA